MRELGTMTVTMTIRQKQAYRQHRVKKPFAGEMQDEKQSSNIKRNHFGRAPEQRTTVS